jgi:hypothetical protein
MKKKYLIIILFATISIITLFSFNSFAGNDKRIGEAGASELLINPWARTTGWADANVACVTGLESIFQNVAGLSFTKKLEFAFSHTQYLVPSGVMLNNGGFAVRVGKEKRGVIALGVMNMNWGDIPVTTENLPDGNGGTFSPSYSVFSLSYAREFSNNIRGGITVKMISESIATISSMGVCFDAGIQYVTGFGRDKNGERYRDNLKFGVTMQNVGTTMKYSGDGITFVGISPDNTHTMTLSHRSQEFELPSLIKIGLSYDVHFWEKAIIKEDLNSNSSLDKESDEELTYISNHKLVIAGSFTANSYTHDQFHLGLEYGFKNILFIRAGYMYEKDIFRVTKSDNDKTIAYDTQYSTTGLLGPTAGVSLQWPFNKAKGSVLAVDYSYRFTNFLRGTHTIGLRIDL